MRNKLILVLSLLLILICMMACDQEEAHEHKYEAATCTSPKVCSCGETVGEALGHSFASATCDSPKTCSRCGTTEGDALGHSFERATCFEPETCSVCGATEGEPQGHSFKNANCINPKTCSLCGITEGDALGHTYEEATCDKAKTCSRCRNTEGSALGHDYIEDICSRCGEQDPDSIPVELRDLVCIDSEDYSYVGSVTDSYENIHGSCHYFYTDYKSYAIFNLNGEYETFSCDIVADDEMVSKAKAKIEFYVDGKLMYCIDEYTRVTGKTEVKFDVTGGQKLTIRVNDISTSIMPYVRIALANAQLKKAKTES